MIQCHQLVLNITSRTVSNSECAKFIMHQNYPKNKYKCHRIWNIAHEITCVNDCIYDDSEYHVDSNTQQIICNQPPYEGLSWSNWCAWSTQPKMKPFMIKTVAWRSTFQQSIILKWLKIWINLSVLYKRVLTVKKYAFLVNINSK